MAKNPPLEDEKKLDLSFKEGQTIKINIGVLILLLKFYFVMILIILNQFQKKADGTTSVPRQKPSTSGNPMGILLPPPPGSRAAAATGGSGFNLQLGKPASTVNKPATNNITNLNTDTKSNADSLLLDFESPQKTA